MVAGALREVLIKPLVAIEAADDTDVHGGSMELLLCASTKLNNPSQYLTYRLDILLASIASSAMYVENAPRALRRLRNHEPSLCILSAIQHALGSLGKDMGCAYAARAISVQW